jgi:hypothetical protein
MLHVSAGVFACSRVCPLAVQLENKRSAHAIMMALTLRIHSLARIFDGS